MLPLASLIISIIALLGVYYTWRSVKANRTWNSLLAASSFIDTSRFDELIDRVDEELERVSVSFEKPLSRDDSVKIFSDKTVEKSVLRLLTYMERTSAMINAGAIDDELAYQFMFGQVVSVYDRFKNFIELRRESRDDQEIMGELQALASRWRVQKKRRRSSKAKVSAQRRPGL